MRRLTAILTVVMLLLGVSSARAENGLNDEGFITTWLILAAIPLEEKQTGADALDRHQVKDEAKLEPKAGDKVKVGEQELTWQPYRAKDYFVDFNDFVGSKTEDSVAYAVCYVHADADMKDVRLKVGSDDQAKAYLNGKEVLKRDRPSPLKKDDSAARVSLRKGANVLVFKVINEKMEWSACARFTDASGRPLKALKVTTTKSDRAEAKKE
jgi:hypothetical protein